MAGWNTDGDAQARILQPRNKLGQMIPASYHVMCRDAFYKRTKLYKIRFMCFALLCVVTGRQCSGVPEPSILSSCQTCHLMFSTFLNWMFRLHQSHLIQLAVPLAFSEFGWPRCFKEFQRLLLNHSVNDPPKRAVLSPECKLQKQHLRTSCSIYIYR